MKTFLAILTAFLLSSTAYAGTGFFYNPDRSGEGIIVTIDDDSRLAFALFTYWDAKYAIPPSVSPPAPPSTITPSPNKPVWYVGTGLYLERIAIGYIHMSVAIDYPNVAGNSIDERITVGEFLIVPNGDGFDLTVDCYDGFLPKSMYICSNTYTFTTLIIGD